MQIYADIRPHLRRFSKVISASHCLSNSRQTPLVIRTKYLSPHSYVCIRLIEIPNFISCIRKFSFYSARDKIKMRITYHKMTFMCKAGQHNSCFEGVESLISRHEIFSPLASYQRGVITFMSPGSPPGFNEGQKSSINIRLDVRYLCVQPVDDIPFAPDD